MTPTSDIHLAEAIRAGDPQAWNTFVARYGDAVFGATAVSCEAGCRVPRSQYACILKAIREDRPEPAEVGDTCREATGYYAYVANALRERLADYHGDSSLGAYVRALLPEIEASYLEAQHGRLAVPESIAAISPLAAGVFRLGCRGMGRAAAAERLGVTPEEVAAAERAIAVRMQSEGRTWWGLAEPDERPAPWPRCDRAEQTAALAEGRLNLEAAEAARAHAEGCEACRARQRALAASPALMTPPAWVNQAVLARGGSDGPVPASSERSWWQKATSQPDWIWGVLLGGLLSALLLLVIFPQQEYARAVKEPGDILIARQWRPLTPETAVAFNRAREQLARGRVDAAVQDLERVLAERPDNQEARWLAAVTYDQLGDRARAAPHYQRFLEVERQVRAEWDDRVLRAERRLAQMGEMP